jgi:4-hydroxy-tetrahydrodipicolinate synthase
MAEGPMQGVFPILLTPFDDDGRIDEESLHREVDFNLEAGVHGLGLALGSEFLKMTEAERQHVTKLVVAQVRGRVPVVVNTGAQSNVAAALYSKQAEELGASAVMCVPPSMGVSPTEMRSYFKAISDAVRVPVWIQDVNYASVPAGVIRQIAEESERVRYAKIESPPNPLKVQQAVEQAGPRVTVFGGSAGTYLIEELRRGSVGTMPWPSTPEIFVTIWDQWQAGDHAAALETFERKLLPVLRVSSTGLGLGHAINKEILKRRGIFTSAHVRRPSDPLDALTERELSETLERVGIA